MPDSNAIKVFFSVGRTSTPQQEEFVGAIEAHMIDRGLMPQALGRNCWSSKQPLSAIDELMAQCSGAAVVGFERLRILHAVDRRGSGAERVLNDCALPTVWNQIEVTMAHVRGLPLLVLVEDGLRTEGLLETTNDWYVKRLPVTAAATSDREFAGIFTDWTGASGRITPALRRIAPNRRPSRPAVRRPSKRRSTRRRCSTAGSCACCSMPISTSASFACSAST